MKKIIALLMLVICSLGVLMSQTNSDTPSDYYDYRNDNYDPCNSCSPTNDYILPYLTNKIDTLPSFIEDMFSEMVNFQYFAPDYFGDVRMKDNIFDTVDISMILTDTLNWGPVEFMDIKSDGNYTIKFYQTHTLDGQYTKNIAINRESYSYGKVKVVKIELIPNNISVDDNLENILFILESVGM